MINRSSIQILVLSVAILQLPIGIANAQSPSDNLQKQSEKLKQQTDSLSKMLEEQNRALSGVVDQFDNEQKTARVARGFPGEDLRWPSNSVAVCWENAGPDTEKERGWVRDAVEKSWQAHSALRFLGWQQCLETSRGIRIAVRDVGPHTLALGKALDGVPNGVVMNFKFSDWSPSCGQSEEVRQSCIRSTSVHLFGHAIGFGHTQNRPDKPPDCVVEPQGQNGITGVGLTPWDRNSVMNYCNPAYNNNGVLSEYDVIAVQLVYGAPKAN
jgi:hypothetical protein